MTCFWNGILSSLTIDDFKYIGLENKPNIQEFILILKNKNIKTVNTTWNNESLSNKQIEENMTHIRDFNTRDINNGYYCSSCEPFLFLITQLFSISINHNYNGHIIKYRINKTPRKLVKYRSDTGHFWKE
tara:strand:+ start:472 stop:861 length:390 start_codon:yes stop_codon:yes gene_type:complete